MGNADKFELVTGHGPEPHVDADDHALLYASFIGSGVYRMTGVKTSEIEVTSENEVTISPGMFLIHGRFCRVKDSIALAIETGSQGQNRNDLVVAEYSYSGNETEIDDIELVVVTGTPANPGSETDPSIEDDLTLFDIEYGGSITEETTVQIPLWRVPKEGLTTQDPVALFEDYVDASTARTSIDPVVLFSDDSPAMGNDVTLSESAANFSALLIECVDAGGVCDSCMIDNPNGKIVSLTLSKFASETWFTINSRVIQISEDCITTYVLNGIRVTGQVNVKTGESDRRGVIAISRVLGYR